MGCFGRKRDKPVIYDKGACMIHTINLFKNGKIAILPAKDLEPKIITYWNYGFDTEVLGINFKTKTEKTLTIELKNLSVSIGEIYKTTRRMTALIERTRIQFK